MWLTKSTQCWLTKSMATIYVHNGVAHRREVLGLQWRCEKVGPVVSRLDEWYRDALLLVTSTSSRMKKCRRAMCLVLVWSSGLYRRWRCPPVVVHRQRGWGGVGVAELLLVSTEVDGLLGRLGARHHSSASQDESATEVSASCCPRRWPPC